DVILHEWSELEVGPGVGSIEHLATWLFEEDSFAPAAKLTAQGSYSVVADHLGTPLALYDGQGRECWQMQLDSYGAVRQGQDCPFRYQGQYEDTETGLYYNRARYYDPETGQYISQDPIGLAGGNQLYNYVTNPNRLTDPLGLAPWKNGEFATWFDNASPAEILANKSSVSAALRGDRGMHEMFPVSLAAKAKELGFTHGELMDMTMPTDQVWFENVPDGKGNFHDGPHSKGAPLPKGQSSKASSRFHEHLSAALGVLLPKGRFYTLSN
ncbi:MAG: hypothetical protein EOO60_03490, partial [Hymenobacter sp.]